MTADITAFIDRCETCKKFAYRQPDEPLSIRTVPNHPWSRVAADLFQHSAPLEDGRSPAELLMGRELRTLLPDFTGSPASLVRKHVQNETKGRQLAPLQQGDIVRGLVAPRSYMVLTEDGRILRRNRQHLRKTPEGFSISINDSDSEDGNDDCLPPSRDGSQPPSLPEPPRNQASPHPPALPVFEQPSAGAGRQSKRPIRLPQRLGYIQGFQQAELI
ncbi:hypothetical protein HPB47_005350 [Ixodes persulcatus]|uniref:Uncharacterized protein n=1 Tax=Ixodes persulcatus TaxID=34615 RepID=A0AC60R1T6_IXOPE|nr:hypothetical protein HPB47_005350 [Ixodes persulcatus]